jgi:endonuclease G
MGIVITQNAAAYQRVKKREEVMKKNIKILSRNDPDEILKIESKTRIKQRKSLLTKDVNLKALITGNEFLPINYLERGKKVSESVCLIEVKNDQGKIIKYGTGFMVSPYLLITNNHVLKNKEDCKKSLTQFNFEDDLYFSPKKEITFSLIPDRFFYTSKSLDFTLVAASLKDLTGQISLSTFGFNKLISGSGKALIGEYVSLIHHPAKDKKQISIRENRFVDIKTILFVIRPTPWEVHLVLLYLMMAGR